MESRGHRDIVIRPEPARAEARVLEPTIWLSYSFAPEWFSDALREARTGHNHHSRRREILFAVCFAESYLFEWVRDEALKRDHWTLARKYLTMLREGSLSDRWEKVPTRLRDDHRIAAVPCLTKHHLREWARLIRYRNGLVHAHASRPETPSLAKSKKPVPSKPILDKLRPGWAVRVVIRRVRLLHKAVGTSAPPWLAYP